MTEPVELTGSGVHVGGGCIVLADAGTNVTLAAIGFGCAELTMPTYAARHLAERLLLICADVDRRSAGEEVEPRVPRRFSATPYHAPGG